MQIKITMRYHDTLTLRMTQIKKRLYTEHWWGCGTLMHCCTEMLNGTTILENSLAVSKNTKHIFFIWSSNSAPRIYPGEMKAYGHIKTYT